MDGHSSHVTANMIAFCMGHVIYLLILPPHCSHFLQPLDISIFGPLKRTLALDTDAVARLGFGRIRLRGLDGNLGTSKSKGNELDQSILSGRSHAGLVPLESMKVLEKLPPRQDRDDKHPAALLHRATGTCRCFIAPLLIALSYAKANALLNSTLRGTIFFRRCVAKPKG